MGHKLALIRPNHHKEDIPLNKNITLGERAEFYNQTFPKFAKQAWLTASDRWLWGTFSIGNNYQGSGYYGSYPPNYLKRILSLFPDAENILHLFSGSLTEVEGEKFDINPELSPDICGDAHNLSKIVSKKYDLILADPPYSEEDAKHYGTPMINRNKVIKECSKITEEGGFILWLDQVLPMYRKTELHRCISIAIERSTNHRFRIVTGFMKL